MAANKNDNKRIAIKWIRDRAKGAYQKGTCCTICESTEELELHHTNGLTNLYDKWVKDNGFNISTDADIIALRDRFIAEFHTEIYVEVYTLCAKHHKALHRVFGKSPLLSTASKQSVWIARQKDKHNGIDAKDTASSAGFSKFIPREVKPSTSGNSNKFRFTSIL